jgi:hypothetical protein
MKKLNTYKIRYAIDTGRKDIKEVILRAWNIQHALALFQYKCDQHRYDEHEYKWFYTEILSVKTIFLAKFNRAL